MRPRQELVELFSAFLQFEGDRAHRWMVDPRLRRSMQRCLSDRPDYGSNPAPTEGFWALYWHQVWQNQTQAIARHHLTAYVQEPCYWAAQKTATGFSSAHSSVADYFQVAIAGLDKILAGFNPHQGFPFKSYASASFHSLIRETLRQRQEVDICTDWALLRKVSQKRFVEALSAAGLPTTTIERNLLVWRLFRERYVPRQASGTRQLPKPDAQTWAAIARQYQSEGGTAATPAQLEQWLLTCARAVRAYLYPDSVSINAARSDDEGGEFLDALPDHSQTSLLQEWIAAEEAHARQNQRDVLLALLNDTIGKLSPELRVILDLYYRQGMTQQEMATHLDTKQYTISRRLTRARETLLKAIAQWAQGTLHIQPTPDLLKHTSLVLDDWLQSHYQPAEPPVTSSIPHPVE